MAQYEGLLKEVVLDPDEVHRNKRDEQIAVLYMQLDSCRYLRVALWMSPHSGLCNSVHSYRRAGLREVEEGRRRGRMIWQKK